METVYGEGNVYQFTSTRKDYADVEKTLEAEMAAVNKALGKEAAQKMMQDFSNCTVWTRSELRKRRWDLSRKAPQDPEAYAKLIGESDHNPTAKEILGEEGYKKFQQINAEAVEVADSTLFRFNPDLSNPPEEVAKVAMDFWHPRATVASVSKTKTKTTMEPASEKEPVKQPK